jgi:nitroreductase
MNVSEALLSRRSVRDYLDLPVAPDVIRRVLSKAIRTPSGGNLQPWHIHVVGGMQLQDLKTLMKQRLHDAPQGEPTEYDIYPKELVAPYKERRHEIGEALYRQLGIPREDKLGRNLWFARNFDFFGAPVGLFCTIDRRMGPPQWSDLGMVMMSIMLLLREEGLDSCPQECWALYPKTITEFLGTPPQQMLFAGMAIGYANKANPVNQLLTPRADTDQTVRLMGL